MQCDHNESGQDRPRQGIESVRQHLAELKQRVGPIEELTSAEQDTFEAKFRNSVRMGRWVDVDPTLPVDNSKFGIISTAGHQNPNFGVQETKRHGGDVKLNLAIVFLVIAACGLAYVCLSEMPL